MAGEAMALNPTRLVIAAILGLAVLLLLIIKELSQNKMYYLNPRIT